jgi:hypothetical protein
LRASLRKRLLKFPLEQSLEHQACLARQLRSLEGYRLTAVTYVISENFPGLMDDGSRGEVLIRVVPRFFRPLFWDGRAFF